MEKFQPENLEDRLMAVLQRHKGQENCIGMGELWRKVFRLPYDHRINDTSELRVLIRKLRRRGMPILSTSDKFNPGYFWAETPEEIDKFCDFFDKRGITSLAQSAAIRKVSLPEYLGQKKLEAEETA